MKQTATKAEAAALEREIQEQQEKKREQVRRAVDPQY